MRQLYPLTLFQLVLMKQLRRTLPFLFVLMQFILEINGKKMKLNIE